MVHSVFFDLGDGSRLDVTVDEEIAAKLMSKEAAAVNHNIGFEDTEGVFHRVWLAHAKRMEIGQAEEQKP